MRSKIAVRLSSLAVVAALAAAFPATSSAAPSLQSSTAKSDVLVWKTSLKLANSTNTKWRGSFVQMADQAQYAERPDVISVLEVPYYVGGAYVDSQDVLLEIQSHWGSSYLRQHMDEGNSKCGSSSAQLAAPNTVDCGNTAIYYDSARLSPLAVKKWSRFEFNASTGQCVQNASTKPDQLAVKFKDLAASGTGATMSVLVAALHFPPPPQSNPTQQTCVIKNVELTNDTLETFSPTRHITLVTGDFNSNVDPDKDLGNAPSTWRDEDSHVCWYKLISQPHEGEASAPCSLTKSFPYYDTVWIREGAGIIGDGAICNDWTKTNEGPSSWNTAFDSCTDTAPNLDKPRGRIDFIFVRYENSSGVAITKPASDRTFANARIPSAGTDRGWYIDPATGAEARYSDHRNVFAKVTWCGTASAPAICS